MNKTITTFGQKGFLTLIIGIACALHLAAQPKIKIFRYSAPSHNSGGVPNFSLGLTPDTTIFICRGDTLSYTLINYSHAASACNSGAIGSERYIIETYRENSTAPISLDTIFRTNGSMPLSTPLCNSGFTIVTPLTLRAVSVFSNVQYSFFIYNKISCKIFSTEGNLEDYHLTKVIVSDVPRAPRMVDVTPKPATPTGSAATLQIIDTDPNMEYVWYKRPNTEAASVLDIKNPFVTGPLTVDTNFYVVAREKLGTGLGGRCGSAFTTVPVFVRNQFFIPNAFSPNNDGLNDVFKIEGKTITSGTLSIYDSWGNLIFKTNDITKGWNGYREGKLQPAGTYVYLTTGTYVDGKPFTLKGSVTLVR